MNNLAALWLIQDKVKYQLYWWGFWTDRRKEKTFTALYQSVRRAAVVLNLDALRQEPPHPALQDFLQEPQCSIPRKTTAAWIWPCDPTAPIGIDFLKEVYPEVEVE